MGDEFIKNKGTSMEYRCKIFKICKDGDILLEAEGDGVSAFWFETEDSLYLNYSLYGGK